MQKMKNLILSILGKRRFIHFLIVLFCFISYSFTIKKLDFDDGLSSNYVQSIAQDRDGFVWFATEFGLNRFDGTKFHVYKSNPNDESSIAANGINKVVVDPKNNKLWIATKNKGLNTYDCVTHKFFRYPAYSDNKNSTKAYGITDLCFSKDGNLWIGTHGNGLKKLLIKKDSIVHIRLPKRAHFKDDRIWAITDDFNGKLYIAYLEEGLCIVSLKNNTVKYYTHNVFDPYGLPDNVVSKIFIDSKKRVWVGTRNGLALFLPQEDKFIVFRHDPSNSQSLINNEVTSMMEMKDHTLWIGTINGISILDLRQDFIKYTQDVAFQHVTASDYVNGLYNGYVKDIYRDVFNNIWIATQQGINFISHTPSYFKAIAYSIIKGEENTLSNRTVKGISYDNKTDLLWLGTGGGGIDLFKQREKVASYNMQNGKSPDNSFLASLVDSNGDVWFGSMQHGLIRLNKSADKFEKVILSPEANQNLYEQIQCLFEDKGKNLWIGTYNGIFRLNLTTKHISFFDGKTIGLPNNLFRSISQDSKGNLWIGTLWGGFVVVTPNFKLIRKIERIKCTNHIYCDTRGRMWVAANNGVFVFPIPGNYNYITITQPNGDSFENAQAIVEGKKDEIWISSIGGIYRYTWIGKKIEVYDRTNESALGTFTSGCMTKSKNGMIYFGSQKGVVYFDSNKDPYNTNVPSVVITGFSIYDTKEIQTNNEINLPVSSEIKLKYNQNTFTIDFNVMDYSLKDQLEYAYSLEGIDDLWYQTKGQKQVTFRDMSPGKYIFKVKCRLKNKSWSEHITTMVITIDPPFWLSWWAKLFYLIVMAATVIWVIRFYRNRLHTETLLYLEKESRRRENDINNERLTFYTNIAHEIRTHLTLILGPLEDLFKSNKVPASISDDLFLIQRSSNRLASLVSQIMEFRKSETNNRQLTVRKDNLRILVQEIGYKYKELNQNKNLMINIIAEAENVELLFDQEIVTIVLDNLISNAIKYTEAGSVKIILRKRIVSGQEIAEIQVTDTGIGIAAEELENIFERYYQIRRDLKIQGTGIGLALVKKLVSLHEGEIEVQSRVGEGASFFFRLDMAKTYPDAIHLENSSQLMPEKQQDDALPTILIVDDNIEIRDYIVRSFVQTCRILTAENGQKAMDLAFESIPDVVISDVMMPVMDGIQLCKSLKEDIRTSHIPVILLTAKDSDLDKMEGYNTGADSYITKPFSAGLLQSRVSNILNSRKKIMEYFKSNTYKNSISSASISQMDKEFLDKIVQVIEKNIDAADLNISFISEQMNMSYSAFYRKVKAVTGMNTNEFIKKVKMNYAAQLLLTRKFTISEVAFQIGYNSIQYFRDSFKAEYGVLPSEYLKNIDEDNS